MTNLPVPFTPPEGTEPYALAIVLCDAIWRDPATGKATLLGIASGVMVSSFPAVLAQICVHVALTDGKGMIPLQVRFVHAEDEMGSDPIMAADAQLSWQDPRIVAELDLVFQGLPVPREGEYRFQLWTGNTFIIERRFMAVKQ